MDSAIIHTTLNQYFWTYDVDMQLLTKRPHSIETLMIIYSRS